MGRSPTLSDEQDQWTERLVEVVMGLIDEQCFSSRDAKEAKLLINILEAHNWRMAMAEAFTRLKVLYIANT